MADEITILETDVLVVGGGGAGARAAIEAAKQNLRVTLVGRGPLGKIGLTSASGGSYVVLESPPGSTFEELFAETVSKGCYLNDQNLVELWWKESTQTVKEFETFGSSVTQNRGNGSYRIRGSEMMSALKSEITRHRNIRLLEDTVVTKLLVHKGVIAGATILYLARGGFVAIKTKSLSWQPVDWARFTGQQRRRPWG